jgi:fructan beta-fructosidase
VWDPAQGVYHLFMQYNPYGDEWGYMSWGHATSKDLITWSEQPVAILTGADVAIFSGSAVIDTANSSGLCIQYPACLIAVYAGNGLGVQTVNLAVSTDAQHNVYRKYEHNPVIDIQNPNFRDPAAFWYPTSDTTGYWVVAVVRSDLTLVNIYRSDDLIHWTLMSNYTDTSGIGWECPDLFSVPVEETGETLWVLTASAGGRGVIWVVGHFDGQSFTALPGQEPGRWIDQGIDFYAAISYKNDPLHRIIMVSWMVNWAYSSTTPTGPYRGQYTIPRALSVHQLQYDNITTYRVFSYPVRELTDYRRQHYSLSEPTTVSATDKDQNLIISQLGYKGGQLYELGICIAYPEPNTAMEVFIRADSQHPHQECTAVTFNFSTTQMLLTFDRTKAGVVNFASAFGSAHTETYPLQELQAVDEDQVCVDFLVDFSSVEIFVQRGYGALTHSIFPTAMADNLGLEFGVLSGSVDVISMDVWRMAEANIRMKTDME